MNYFTHILLGYAMAFVGVLPPGMLNMTAMKTAISVNKRAGLMYALGAALMVVPQSFIALYFARFFSRHPEIIENLSIAGVVSFVWSGYLFSLAGWTKNHAGKQDKKG
ncbi:MAG: LysE family transporter [Flavobacteriaceae bacterium]|nr:LysE family transporter [Flavobacteriaceae bacterium]